MSKAPDYKTFIKDGLIEPENLSTLLAQGAANLKLVDASFVMPGAPVNARDIHKAKRIDHAVFFDIDEICDPDSPLPHMVPSPEKFGTDVGNMGIGSDDFVVVYDQSGIAMAAARVWWMFRLYGHDKVCVLNGGLPYWEALGYPVNTDPPINHTPATFESSFRPHLLKTKEEIRNLVDAGKGHDIADARTPNRYSGQRPEPRPGLRSGHIPGSCNLPFPSLIEQDTGRLKDKQTLKTIFNENKLQGISVTSCGSGVTACVLNLALFYTGFPDVAMYDGSWTEWGQDSQNTPVAHVS